MIVLFFLLNAACCAFSVAIYAENGNPVSLGCAVLNGLVALLMIVRSVSE